MREIRCFPLEYCMPLVSAIPANKLFALTNDRTLLGGKGCGLWLVAPSFKFLLLFCLDSHVLLIFPEIVGFGFFFVNVEVVILLGKTGLFHASACQQNNFVDGKRGVQLGNSVTCADSIKLAGRECPFATGPQRFLLPFLFCLSLRFAALSS